VKKHSTYNNKNVVVKGKRGEKSTNDPQAESRRSRRGKSASTIP
jgi:hypothetical protein